MIELWLLLTFMVLDCILLKIPWSLIDIQLSILHGDRKEQHSSNFWPNCVYACFFLSIIPNVLIVVIMFSHFIMVSSSIPYVSHHSIYGNTNLVVECARYFEKVSTFDLRLLCFTLFVKHNLLCWHFYCVWHIWYSMQDIHDIVNTIHCPWGSVHIW